MRVRQSFAAATLLLLTFAPSLAYAAGNSAPGDKVSLGQICTGLPTFLQSLANVPKAEQPNTNYPVLIFREHVFREHVWDKTKTDLALYWKSGGVRITGQAFVRLGPKSFTPISYTTEPLLVLTCHIGDKNSPDPTLKDVAVTQPENGNVETDAAIMANGAEHAIIPGTDQNARSKPVKKEIPPPPPSESFDKITIDAAKDNSITYIYFYDSSGNGTGAVEVNTTKPGTSAPPPVGAASLMAPKATVGEVAGAADKPQDAGANPPVVAWAIIERHKVEHYSIGGGFVGFHGQSHSYTAITVPTTINTQTCVGTLVTTQPGATGISGSSGSSGATTSGYSFSPCSSLVPDPTLPAGTTISSYESNVTSATSAGTASYAFGTQGQPWSVDALAGVTVYPFGHDTYPPSIGRGFSVKYGFEHPLNSLGIFLGTSVNNFGNFTGGFAYEVFPGVEAMAGTTFWSKTMLAPNITACTGYGTSPSYTLAPNSTEDNVTVAYTAASTSGSTPTPATNTITDAKTTITTTATSGCANGDKATMISGTTVLTQSAYKPAFSFGIIFNSNLSKAFSSVFK